MPVKLAVVGAADRNGEFIADLAAERAKLGKAQMMGVGRRATAQQAGLAADELAVVLVAQADCLGRQRAAADAG